MEKKTVLTVATAILLLLTPLIATSIRPASAYEILKVGVMVPYGLPQGHAHLGGAEGGAILAAKDINVTGIKIGTTTYMIQLFFAKEWALENDYGKTYNATRTLLEAGCRFIIGGFRTETTWAIIEAISDWNIGKSDEDKVIYFINGAATDELCSTTVGSNYNDYKWLFRINPINSTMLFRTMLGWIKGYLIPKKLAPLYGKVNYSYIVEDYMWTQGISWYLENVGLGPQARYIGGGARTTPGTTDFSTFMDNIKNLGGRLVVIAYTLPDVGHMLKRWRQYEYPFVVVGIDVFGQTSLWPTPLYTGGACEYEMLEDFAGYRTPITPLAVKFWDNFVGNFSAPGYPPAWPIYTAWGAYNGFLVLKQTLEGVNSLNSTKIIQYLETHESQLLNGIGKFTPIHDVYCNSYGHTWPEPHYTRAVFVQWLKLDTILTKQVICPVDQLYSRKAHIPPWVYELEAVDLDFSKEVDIFDIVQIGLAFGSVPGDPNWDIESDVNNDANVDIFDLVQVALFFGATATPK